MHIYIYTYINYKININIYIYVLYISYNKLYNRDGIFVRQGKVQIERMTGTGYQKLIALWALADIHYLSLISFSLKI